jgi:2'-5' RNA ligase
LGALFFAVRLHRADRQLCSRWLSGISHLGPGLIPVAPEDLHYTVLFLGRPPAVERASALALGSRVASASPPFLLLPGGLGKFGAALRPTVLWLGVRVGEEALRALNRDLERQAAEVGLPHDSTRFVAHCTLARVRRGSGPDVVARLEELGSPLDEVVARPRTVGRFELLETVPAPAGAARYRTVAAFQFG